MAEITSVATMVYEYDALGRRTVLQTPGQDPVAYTYDAASRLTTVAQGTRQVTLQYDNGGRRTRVLLPNGVSAEYDYDNASRITGIHYRNASGPLGDLHYEYDGAGNRVVVGGSFGHTLLPDPVTAATYDTASRQQTYGDRVMTFDANGNVRSVTAPNRNTRFGWDARNRLAAVTSDDLTATYQYDSLGRRTTKTSGGSTTTYVHDGLNPVLELSDRNAAASILTGLGIDEYFVRTQETDRRAILTDALGSTIAEAQPDGTLAAQYIYDPFGSPQTTGTSTNPFLFAGREYDPLLGLYHYRARYYSPAAQRFLSPDPLLVQAAYAPILPALAGRGDVNAYAYAGNNPQLDRRDRIGAWRSRAKSSATVTASSAAQTAEAPWPRRRIG